VGTGGQQIEGDWRERGQYGLDEGLTAGAVTGRCPVHAVQQLGRSDRSDPDLLGGADLFFQASAHLGHGARRIQAARGALELDEDRGV
jgi:hypothetical protein